ncbi:MAG: Rieske (2Fe-2S) iron-sulfur domain protein [Deltaproteobacteria bacterium]|nr:Rieske (2Fe-2S) iron-sulfur domain protein [Deltaproteobacteria bacterium]
MTDQWRAVARVGEIRRGDVLAVTVDALELVVGLDGDRYFATQRRCVHQGGDLADGIVSRGHLICPQHGWRFATATGCAPESSEYCLVTYAVRVVGDQIEVQPSPLAPSSTKEAPRP